MTTENEEKTHCLVFSVPYTDVEIVSFIGEKKSQGIIYNPLRAVAPIPWSSKCPHCQQGQQKEWKLDIRKALQLICSVKFSAPNNYEFYITHKYRASGQLDLSGWCLRVFRSDRKLTMDVIQLTEHLPVFDGPVQDFRSRFVSRGLKLIFSARMPSSNELQACMKGLQEAQPPAVKHPCHALIWP